jgi:hypothetical protein
MGGIMNKATLDFRRSSFCRGATQCVEVAFDPQSGVMLRDSNDRAIPPCYFDAEAWRALLAEIKGHYPHLY